MDGKKKKSSRISKNSSPEHKCTFCNKVFKQEKSLLNHTCEKKRRFLWKDEKYIKLGFFAFEMFYYRCFRQNKKYLDFVNSQYFTSFTKFGKHLLDIKCINPEGFIEFVIKSEIKIDDWCKDYVYQTWINETLKKEPIDRSIERTFSLMKTWSDENGEDWIDFFRKVNPFLATGWILSGRVSPWLLYSRIGQPLMERLSDEQLLLIARVLDPDIWARKMLLHRSEVNHFTVILTEEGL